MGEGEGGRKGGKGFDNRLSSCIVLASPMCMRMQVMCWARVYLQICLSISSLFPVGDTVTSANEARQGREWVKSNKVTHIMSREDPPQSI